MDYGHDLLFGVFITPTSADPLLPVDLTLTAEDAGLDLATFQDHPYQPALQDAWTLMSYVAARTERIHLAGNVLNLPLRNPVVLARAAASLDRLTGGRVELGLGAGGFREAIASIGGPSLTPGRSMRGLDEAITILREVWDAEARGGIRVDGTEYRISGAKRGPAPAHDIGIWVGALGPKMLDLVGRRADGWLPSLGNLREGVVTLDEMNAKIDAGAVAAGRSPSDVRRLANLGGTFAGRNGPLLAGPLQSWAPDLAELAVDHGLSGFILASDDAAEIELYGSQVAPEVRELVARRRAAG
ncbi:LLM class flavin-dependent oxidoreductase [Gordonia phosphorivorans]|uniref:LLM class flavin-dependent oxidoreductase n=1 Tax=Gordonia phosphorivorans TaxID=1056982 RepID=A0ABV6H9W0_9ACTN